MKVSALLAQLNELDKDADICVLYWTKDAFEYDEDDELTITDKGWEKVVTEFDEMEFFLVGEWIADAVHEYSEVKN